jgi:quinoprotein glucose dehydrogenase
MKNMERFKWGGNYPYSGTLYNPPIVGNVNGLLGAINLGNAAGGTNWPGAGFDPETNIAYLPASLASIAPESVSPPPEGFSDIPFQAGVVGEEFRLREAAGTGTYADAPKRPERSGGGFGASQARNLLSVEGLSIVKPPYGVLAAIDVNKGDLLWQVPHGDTPDNVRNHPMLKGMNIPKTGQNGSVGLAITKTLVIMGDPQVTTTEDHPRGAMLRAYDKNTGAQVGAVWMPAPQSGSPMTYMVDGKQYIIVAVSGGPYSGEYIAFSLPDSETQTSGGR